MSVRWPAAALAAAAVAAGCGASAGDLALIQVAGGPTHLSERIRITDDGRASCDARGLEEIPNDRLLDAREVKREMKKLAEHGASFTLPRPGARRYRIVTSDGTVSWTGGAPGPAVLGKASLLALQLERQLCRR